MDVNNEVCFSSGRKLKRCVAALINDRIKIILRITQLLNVFESNVIKNGQTIKVRLGYVSTTDLLCRITTCIDYKF